ncbi:MAG: endonuclease/exonuclease/phosphatase family protein [Thermodesulfobacteriota bacterium]
MKKIFPLFLTFPVFVVALCLQILTLYTWAGQSIKIATWNIRDLSTNSRSDFELIQISYILRNYDFIAIQEVNDQEVILRLAHWLKVLGNSYGSLISPVSGTGSEKERYAFLFRKDIIEAVDLGHLAEGDFARPPYLAAFKAGNFDFKVLSIHVCSGCGGLGEGGREEEVQHLADVYNDLIDNTENDVLIVGDFNLNPNNESFQNLKSVGNTASIYSCTTPTECEQNATTTRDTNLFDNIWFSQTHVREYTGQHGMFKFDEELFEDPGDGSKEYREQYARFAVSDHRPVWAEFRIDMVDDD